MDPEVGGSSPPNCTSPIPQNSEPPRARANDADCGGIGRMSGLRPCGGDSKIREFWRRPAASLHLQIGDLHFGPNWRLEVYARRSDRRTTLSANEDIRDKNREDSLLSAHLARLRVLKYRFYGPLFDFWARNCAVENRERVTR